MNVRVLVAGESNVANLARFPGFHNRFIGPALREYAIWIIEANDFMMLHQIDMVGLQAFKTSFNLPRRNLFGTPRACRLFGFRQMRSAESDSWGRSPLLRRGFLEWVFPEPRRRARCLRLRKL